MRIVFYASDQPRERALAAAFRAGAGRYGHETTIIPLGTLPTVKEYDLACMVGVKARLLWNRVVELGIPPLMFDKGYDRHKFNGGWEYWRLSYQVQNPDRTLTLGYPSDRFDAMGVKVKPWRKSGKHILYAGSSEKAHAFWGIPPPTQYAKQVVSRLREVTDRPIIYRPKPSWRGAMPVHNAEFSHGNKRTLAADLEGCYALVVYGSNACFEAALSGVPSIILGNGVLRSISSTDLADINKPRLGDRETLFHAIAYHQWTMAEMMSGEAFNTIARWLA